jgi:hypothetical protein
VVGPVFVIPEPPRTAKLAAEPRATLAAVAFGIGIESERIVKSRLETRCFPLQAAADNDKEEFFILQS